MKPIDYIILAVILLIVGSVLWYIRRAKKKGVKCIGCPSGGNCGGGCTGCNGDCQK